MPYIVKVTAVPRPSYREGIDKIAIAVIRELVLKTDLDCVGGGGSHFGTLE